MAYSEYLAERVRQRLSKAGVVTEKKMMGGLVFMINHKMCIGVDKDKKSKVDRLMLRVGAAAYSELLQKKASREMDLTGKPMRGFLFVYPQGFDKDKDMEFWVERALIYNREISQLI